MNTLAVIILGIWILTSILSYGFYFAYYQREYPTIAGIHYWSDLVFAVTISLFPLAGLIVAVGSNRIRHGLKFK